MVVIIVEVYIVIVLVSTTLNALNSVQVKSSSYNSQMLIPLHITHMNYIYLTALVY